MIATNGYSDGLWPGLRRTIVPLFGAIAASAELPEKTAQAIMPGRSVLYESGAITVYYRVDTGRRLLIGGRGPMREVGTAAEMAHMVAYACDGFGRLDGRRMDPCLGRAACDDARPLSPRPRTSTRVLVAWDTTAAGSRWRPRWARSLSGGLPGRSSPSICR